MKQTTVKRIAALTLFILAGTLLRTLRADAPVKNSADQTSPELSWPRAKLLDPSFKWHQSQGIAEKCLLVGRLNPNDQTAMNIPYAVDLSGEHFVAALTGSGSWDFKEILKEAGYAPHVTIPEKQVLLGGPETVPRDRAETGYIKRAGNKIRFILISYNDDNGARTASAPGAPQAPNMRSVFISNITTIEQILKEQKRSHIPKT